MWFRFLFIFSILAVQASAFGSEVVDLTSLSLEELMGIEVTLASRKEERLFTTAAAVYALTKDDLRRSGVTSFPAALRLVPGLQVARLDASKWAIGARGFDDRFTQKLLVLVDGRQVYSPTFSGVYWEVQDLPLEDVERIEVIRGPGATLWGANAVNGIINVVTRPAQETQGVVAALGGGSEERGFGTVRYGGRLGGGAFYRVYARAFARDCFVDTAGQPAADDWHMFHSSFRVDWNHSRQREFDLDGGIYFGQVGQTFQLPLLTPPFQRSLDDYTDMSGGHVRARWQHHSSRTSDWQLQLYYDRNHRADSVVVIDVGTYDLDFQHRVVPARRHDVVWGLGYRFVGDQTKGSAKLSFDPASRRTSLFSAFAQDDVSLVPDRLRLTLGSKFEHNDFTGFEYQPNVRLLWIASPQQTMWAAVSRAVRTPARADDDVRLLYGVFSLGELPLPGLPSGTYPVVVNVRGDRSFVSEELLALELGYRVNPAAFLFFDLTAFYNLYTHLRTGRDLPLYLEPSPSPPHLVWTVLAANIMDGTTRGGELAADWQARSGRARLRAGYTYVDVVARPKPGANLQSKDLETGSPHHQLFLWPSLTPRSRVQLDGMVRYVAALPGRKGQVVSSERLPTRDIGAYWGLDVRVGWELLAGLEVSLTGQDLLDDRHLEYSDYFLGTRPSLVQRGVYGALTWRR